MGNRQVPPLEPGWRAALAAEFEQPYMQALRDFLAARKAQRRVIYPHSSRWFHALEQTPLERVKVVILGQDPYHGPGQAHGLCFSVPAGVAIPPSLANIHRELVADLGLPAPTQGNLEPWAHQGVLLLNSVLTVEQAQAGSHRNQGWETFTDRVIAAVNERPEPCVFLLWGSYAQKKGAFIDSRRHGVFTAPHPSPLSAHRGFLGCRHFSRANEFLQAQGVSPVNWRLD